VVVAVAVAAAVAAAAAAAVVVVVVVVVVAAVMVSPNTVSTPVVKSARLRWTGHIARMKTSTIYKVLVGNYGTAQT
jgi:hypothetical protein